MRITALCKGLHCLPYNGGLMEQPGYAMLRIEKVLEAHDVWEEFQEKKRGARR